MLPRPDQLTILFNEFLVRRVHAGLLVLVRIFGNTRRRLVSILDHKLVRPTITDYALAIAAVVLSLLGGIDLVEILLCKSFLNFDGDPRHSPIDVSIGAYWIARTLAVLYFLLTFLVP